MKIPNLAIDPADGFSYNIFQFWRNNTSNLINPSVYVLLITRTFTLRIQK